MWGYGPDWGMMGGWDGGWGWFGLLHMLTWPLVLGLVIVGVVWLVRAMVGPRDGSPLLERRSSGLDILDEHYARGEITREDYLQKRRDILG